MSNKKSIWVIRHSIRENTTDVDTPISEEGVKMAQVRGEIMSKYLDAMPVFYVSPFKRAIETANAIRNVLNSEYYKDNPIKIMPEFAEDIMTHTPELPAELAAQLAGVVSYPETNDDVQSRCNAGLQKILDSVDNNVVIVTHGKVCNILLNKFVPAYQVPLDQNVAHPMDYVPNYCALTRVEYENGAYTVLYTDIKEFYGII